MQATQVLPSLLTSSYDISVWNVSLILGVGSPELVFPNPVHTKNNKFLVLNLKYLQKSVKERSETFQIASLDGFSCISCVFICVCMCMQAQYPSHGFLVLQEHVRLLL